MRPRAVLLDALGTLLALEDPAPALVGELADRHGISVTHEEARTALKAEMTFYRAHHDEGADAGGLAALRRRCAGVLRDALPPASHLDLDDVLAALLAALRFRPYPEVPGVLEELRGRGVTLIVVSNWDVSLHDVLASTGLAPLVDGAITSAEAGAPKPQPEVFARALELAGVGAEAALHVGDTPEHDVAGALAAGIEPVLVLRDQGARPPVPGLAAPAADADTERVRTIASLAELPALAT